MKWVFSLVLAALGVPALALSQCPLAIEFAQSSSQLWSSALDSHAGRFFVSREGATLHVYEVIRSASLELHERFTVPIQNGTSLSLAFSQDDLVLSQWQTGGGAGDNLTPQHLSGISYYRLSDGQLDSTKSFNATSASFLPTPAPTAPFFQPNWAYTSWQAPMCQGLPSGVFQQGRVIAAHGDTLFVAHHAEQENYCHSDPNYYRYHLLPNGNPELQIAREGTNSFGQPVGRPLCDLDPSYTQVASCRGTLQDTCEALNASGQVLPGVGGCTLRMAPRPILAFEHCPTCSYWWSALDPGGVIYESPGATSPHLTGRFTFPPSLIDPDPNDPESIGVPPDHISIGAITSMSADPLGSGFAMAVDLSVAIADFQDVGGVLFFSSTGQYTGFGGAIAGGTHLGESGALAPVGPSFEGQPLYAVGSGRNVSRGNGGWNLPANILPDFHPEAGIVFYFSPDGSRVAMDSGDTPGQRFGASVTALGDVNGDTGPDALIGAPGGDFVAINSILPLPDQTARGTMLRLVGPTGSEFGRQVASVSTGLNFQADVAIVASADKIRLYDIRTCTQGLHPVFDARATLRRLLPGMIAKTTAIVERIVSPGPRITNNSNLINAAVLPLSYDLAEFRHALSSSPDVLPSNEELLRADIDNAMTVLNTKLNIRDYERGEIPVLQRNLRSAPRSCRAAMKNFRIRPTRQCARWVRMQREYNTAIAKRDNAIVQARNAKGVLLANFNQIQAELNSLI